MGSSKRPRISKARSALRTGLDGLDGLRKTYTERPQVSAKRPPSHALHQPAEVEDNWIRDVVESQPKRYPFGCSVRDAESEQYPDRDDLLAYFTEVRGLSRKRLETTTETDFGRTVSDEHCGQICVRDVWAGVVTSFAWHAGQIALMSRLMPR